MCFICRGVLSDTHLLSLERYLREALAWGGVGDERQVGPLGGTAFCGGAAVCDDGGGLGESRGGRFRAPLPEEDIRVLPLAEALVARPPRGRPAAGGGLGP